MDSIAKVLTTFRFFFRIPPRVSFSLVEYTGVTGTPTIDCIDRSRCPSSPPFSTDSEPALSKFTGGAARVRPTIIFEGAALKTVGLVSRPKVSETSLVSHSKTFVACLFVSNSNLLWFCVIDSMYSSILRAHSSAFEPTLSPQENTTLSFPSRNLAASLPLGQPTFIRFTPE